MKKTHKPTFHIIYVSQFTRQQINTKGYIPNLQFLKYQIILRNMVRKTKQPPTRKLWTKSEDQMLKNLVNQVGRNWLKIGEELNKSKQQCSQRWKRIKPKEVRTNEILIFYEQERHKFPFTRDEDQTLLQYYRIYGPQWGKIAVHLNNRQCKQVRERFINHLDPKLNKEAWTEEEDGKILQQISIIGTKWSQISNSIKGRSENMIKNRYYAVLKKKIVDQHEFSEPAVIKTEFINEQNQDEKNVKIKIEETEASNQQLASINDCGIWQFQKDLWENYLKAYSIHLIGYFILNNQTGNQCAPNDE